MVHITTVLSQLNCELQRVTFKLLLFAYSEGIAPNYFSELMTVRQHLELFVIQTTFPLTKLHVCILRSCIFMSCSKTKEYVGLFFVSCVSYIRLSRFNSHSIIRFDLGRPIIRRPVYNSGCNTPFSITTRHTVTKAELFSLEFCMCANSCKECIS